MRTKAELAHHSSPSKLMRKVPVGRAQTPSRTELLLMLASKTCPESPVVPVKTSEPFGCAVQAVGSAQSPRAALKKLPGVPPGPPGENTSLARNRVSWLKTLRLL